MNPKRTQARRRRGYTLLEVTVSILVLMTAMMVSVRVLGWLGHERRSSERRQWAVQAASNALERVSSEPFDRVTADRVKAIADEAGAARALPGASWEISVDDDTGPESPSRRVSLRLRWDERAGVPAAPVRLTCWVFKKGDSK